MDYMLSVFLFASIWLLFFACYPRLRSCLVLSAFLFLPAGFSQALFVPDYWNPQVLFRFFGLFDPESLLFAFFTGGIASVLYPSFFGYDVVPLSGGKPGFSRHLFWIFPALASITLIFAAIYTNIPVIQIAFAAFLFGILHMLTVRPDMFRACMWGAVLFLTLYSGVGLLMVIFSREFIISAWNVEPVFGLRLFHIPVDEFIYSFLFGGLWSTVYCGIFGYRFEKKTAAKRPLMKGKDYKADDF